MPDVREQIPTIFDADVKSLGEIGRDSRRLAARVFIQFGASGRRWERREIVAALAAERAPEAERAVTSELAGVRLADDIVLVTYVSQAGSRRCRRSSIWRKTPTGWRVYFHQGAPIA